MGWLSRTFRSADDTTTPEPDRSGPPVPVAPAPVAPAPVADDGPMTGPVSTTGAAAAPASPASPGPVSAPTGRYGPLVSVTHFDTAPPELDWQLPLNGELYRLMPGSDRPDYSLLVLERPLHFYPREGFDLGRVEQEQRVEDRKGRTMVRVHALLLCARFVGQQLHPAMRDLAVNLAYVLDNSLARDAEVDFGKIEFAAIGYLSEGHSPRPATETPEGTPEGTPAEPRAEGPGVGTLLDEAATVLRQGIEAQRGTSVQRMTAALSLDAEHVLTGLSGNADGQAPVPTPETFARLADVLARLGEHGEEGGVAAFTVRVDGQSVTHEVTGTHGSVPPGEPGAQSPSPSR